MNSLLQVTRETTQAMTQLAQRVSELTQEVQRYKTSETGRNRGGS
jgi:prefoldin subunit 5